MMPPGTCCPEDPGRLLGDLPGAEEERLEEHLFACSFCAARIESMERIGRSILEVVRRSRVAANVNGAFAEQALRDGLTLREYRIPAGETVACTAGPEDLVVVRLAADFTGATSLRLDVSFHDLESGRTAPTASREVVADRLLGEVVLIFPGEVVRTYPRSTWTLRVQGESPSRKNRVRAVRAGPHARLLIPSRPSWQENL